MKEQWREVVLIVFLVAISIFLFSKQAVTVSESIIITEICPSGCALTDHQWIEIYNKSSEPIDLAGWKFWEGGVNHGLTLSPSSTVTSTILSSGAYAVITQNDRIFFGDHPSVTSTVFDSAWTTLTKTGEEIGIKKGNGIDDFVEQFVYASVDKYSLERIHPNGDPASMLEWKEHPDASTPGSENYWWVQSGEGSVNRIPYAQFTLPTSTLVGETVIFDAFASSDFEGFIERYVWMIEGLEYEGVSVEYVFTATGTKHISLTVYDTASASSTISRDIEVVSLTDDEEIIQRPPPRIFINEFLSDPHSGEKEWIELYNSEDGDVVLGGYTLYDGVGKIANVTGTIEAFGFRTAYLTSSKLNQTGDRIVLMDPTGDVVDSVSYGNWEDGDITDNAGAPKKGYSTARNSDGEDTDIDQSDFSYTITPTPNFPNNITADPVPVPPQVVNSPIVYSQEATQTKLTFPDGSVVVSEFVSAPSTGVVEFVELYNTTSDSISLEGWILRDGSGANTTLVGTISAWGFFVIDKPKGSLNNAGDLIMLLDPSGKEIDRVVYGNWNGEDSAVAAPSKGQSAARTDSVFDFRITDLITKGSINQIVQNSVSGGDRVNTSTSSTLSSSDSDLSIDLFSPEFLPIITEVLPNPLGADTQNEYVELYNPFDRDISLAGLFLDDIEGGSKPYAFSADSMLRSHEYRVWYSKDTKLSFANTSDSVRILDSEHTVLQEVEYFGAKENKSYTSGADMWFWTSELSPNTENPLAPLPDVVSDTRAKTTAAKTAVKTTLAQVRNFDVGTPVTMDGVVLVPPGVLSTQYVYVGSESGIGIQVYSYKKEFPEIASGDKVVISGELSEVSGEMRVKLASLGDVELVHSATTTLIAPYPVAVVDVGESYEGGLVEVTGEITGVKGSYIYLDDGTDEVKLYIRGGSGIDKNMFVEGARARVAGIVQETKSGYHISPRDQSDVVVENNEVRGEKIEAENSLEPSYSSTQLVRVAIILFAGFALVLGSRLYGVKMIEFIRSRIHKREH